MKFLFYSYTQFMFMTLICCLMGVTLLIFFLYHCTLVKRGVTTNEKVKISCYTAGVEKKMSAISSRISHLKSQDSPESKEELVVEEKRLSAWRKKHEGLSSYGKVGFLSNLKSIFNENP